MRKKINVENILSEVNNQVVLCISKEEELLDTKATGQLLVDSDQEAFIYLVERNNDYTYIVLGKMIWPSLKEGMTSDSTFLLSNGQEKIELINLKEELMYLIDNIRGNSNYGEDMVTSVELIF